MVPINRKPPAETFGRKGRRPIISSDYALLSPIFHKDHKSSLNVVIFFCYIGLGALAKVRKLGKCPPKLRFFKTFIRLLWSRYFTDENIRPFLFRDTYFIISLAFFSFCHLPRRVDVENKTGNRRHHDLGQSSKSRMTFSDKTFKPRLLRNAVA